VIVQAILTRRREHPVMLSPTTLAAFSGVAPTGLGQSGSVHRVRAAGVQQPQSALPAAPATRTPAGPDSDAAPGRVLPRGSLLDLSV
jgi:hypothetical protein